MAWLMLVMVLIGAYNAIARYLERDVGLQLSSNALLELQWYLFGAAFLFGAPDALRRGAHVRVDVIYGQADARYRSMVDLLGSLFFVLPLCAALAWFGWDYVANAWAVREGSTEVGGLPYLYLLKTLILVFALLLALQAIATIVRSVLRLQGHPLSS